MVAYPPYRSSRAAEENSVVSVFATSLAINQVEVILKPLLMETHV